MIVSHRTAARAALPLAIAAVLAVAGGCGDGEADDAPPASSAAAPASTTAQAAPEPTADTTATDAAAPTDAPASSTATAPSSTVAEGGPSPDPVLTIATTNLPPSGSDPVTGYAFYGEGERLLYPVAGAPPKPWLATSVESADAAAWRITLRDDVTFQNGTPMTAKKVASWLENELKNDYDPGVYQDAVIGVDGPDTVTVTFPTPRPAFAYDLASYALPVYDLEALQSIGDRYGKLAGLGIFTGPYQLSDISTTEWTYTANDRYWAGDPALERIVRLGVQDEQAGVLAVRNGEADILELASPKLKPSVEAMDGVHFVTGDPSLQPEFVAVRPNLTRAPWDDPVVRRALALTIDSEDISAKSSSSVLAPVKGVFPPGNPLEVDWMGADLAEANRLLDDAGWVRGEDGVREKDGVRLAGKLLTSEQVMDDVAVVLAENAKAAGFELTPTLGDAQAVYDQVTAGDFDLSITYGQNMGYDGDPAGLCDMFDPSYGFAATTSATDPVIRKACDQLATTRDPEVVGQVVRDVEQRNADQVFVLPVVSFVPASVTNDAWSDYRPNYFFDLVGWQTRSS